MLPSPWNDVSPYTLGEPSRESYFSLSMQSKFNFLAHRLWEEGGSGQGQAWAIAATPSAISGNSDLGSECYLLSPITGVLPDSFHQTDEAKFLRHWWFVLQVIWLENDVNGAGTRKPTVASSLYMLLNGRKESWKLEHNGKQTAMYLEGRHQILDKDGRLNTPNLLSPKTLLILTIKSTTGSGEGERKQVT